MTADHPLQCPLVALLGTPGPTVGLSERDLKAIAVSVAELLKAEPVDHTRRVGADPFKTWFTVAEAAEYAGVSPTTLGRVIRAHEIRASRPGSRGMYRIHRDDLEAWLRGEVYEQQSLPREVRPRRRKR